MDCHCRLENALRNFACLTTGDVIAINYNEKVKHLIQIELIFKALFWVILMEVVGFFQIYELRVMETKPDKAVSIIECDMNVRSLTTQEYNFLVSTENSTCFSGGFWCSFGLQRTWTATSAPRGTNCKDYALTQNFTLWTSWLSECLYRKEKITAVMLTWTWASGWVGVHVLEHVLCQPRAEELMKTTFLLFNLGFHWLWQSLGW